MDQRFRYISDTFKRSISIYVQYLITPLTDSFLPLSMLLSSDTVFNVIILMTKLLGVLPYDHVRKRISPFWCLYSLLIISICTIEVAFIVFDPPLLAKNSLIRNILFRSQMLALYACIIIFNLCILAYRNKMSSVFRTLEKLDNEMQGEPDFLTILGYLLGQSAAISITVFFDMRGNHPLDTTVSVALSYYYGMISIIIVGTVPFVAIVQFVNSKMECLVMTLRSHLQTCTFRLYKYVILYDRMVSLLTSLNEIFNLQLLLISFVSFFNLTINMYFIADYIVNHPTRSRSRMVPVYIGWITMFSSMVIFPIYSCQRISKQVCRYFILYQCVVNLDLKIIS